MLQRLKAQLNDSTAEFKASGSVDNETGGATTVPVTVDGHIEAINNVIAKLKRITGEAEQEIGWRILAIKTAEPNEWEAIVRTRCKISRTRAFELMRIADKTKTVEESRHQNNVRQVRFRWNHAVRYITDDQLRATHRRELADARAQRDELEEGHARQLIRFENEIARLGDARDLSSERDRLRKALGEIAELLAEMRGLMTQAVRNRVTITKKITRAEKIATSAVKAAIVNLPIKQVA
jgi:hypothetical protein